MRTARSLVPVLLVGALALTACGSDADAGAEASADAPLKVGVSPVPHAEILQFVDDELAEGAGIDLELVEFTDYVQPNVALDDGSLDANYFQHEPYLEEQKAAAGYDFVAVTPVHLEPLGLYSDTVGSVDELAEGAQVAIPNDPTNGARALQLLADQGLITLADTGEASATVLDVETNPKNLKFVEIEAAQLPRSLPDVDAAVINGNYAIEADLSPAEDAIAAESPEGNPYANLLVVRAGDEDDPRIVKLAELLASDEVAQFIEETYSGTVISARS
ncbi:MetQ/NlpA family ABC transporter substrate-binding protein [Ornithinimicrobium humiphilum]|uniref:Lipoprotein n=1 Tax=Ornithinimicrobium humiphilum TaxID=125288 RepID=A0A543KRG5_9MICO|nr:MetQ/NlpA family ABC transporter substrate-binding protein [Ornithinimicrobium humiphilum]TQM97666.1 D-methionine transport system substrate-binding protein [Ornithinimicrobium humiphilum]